MKKAKKVLVTAVNLAIILASFIAVVYLMPWSRALVIKPCPTEEEWQKMEEFAYNVVQTVNYNEGKLEVPEYDVEDIKVTELKILPNAISVEVKKADSYVKAKVYSDEAQLEKQFSEGKKISLTYNGNPAYSRYQSSGNLKFKINFSSKLKTACVWFGYILATVFVTTMLAFNLMMIVWWAVTVIKDFVKKDHPTLTRTTNKLSEKLKKLKIKFIEWLKERGEV